MFKDYLNGVVLKKHFKLFFLLCTCFIICINLKAQNDTNNSSINNESKILFLTLHINNNNISLIDSKVYSGYLKKPRIESVSIGLYYEVISSDNKIVETGFSENPLIKHFEYEDPDRPGQIVHKIVKLQSTDFMLRIRYNENINHIKYYFQNSTDKSDRKFIGLIELNLNGEIKK